MEDKYLMGIGLGIFSVGLLSGVLLRRFASSSKSESIDTFKKLSRLAAIRAQGLGRNHKMIFVVRTDLQMGKGKIAAQVAHAAVMCYQKAMVMDQNNLDMWEATGAAKICVKADGDENCLKALQRKANEMKLVSAIVRDGGHTQVAPGTMTVLGIGPAPVSQIDEITSHLKLL